LYLQLLSQLSDTSTHLERLWAYVTLGASGIITEETSPLIGGLAAHDRELRLTLVVLSVAIGTWLADLLLYYLGRWRGPWLRRRWPKLEGIIMRALHLVRRHPWRSSIAVRYAYGLRFTLPVVCGAARLPFALYAVGSAISALTWSLTFSVMGWWIGRTTRALGGHPRRYELYLTIAMLGVGVIVYFISRRRHVAEKTVEVLDAD
jgi:membrane protein DedA with SNARE-associated domain